MRAKNVTGTKTNVISGKARKKLSAVRLMAIGLCFITVFALTLAFGSGLIGTPDLEGRVAEAAAWDTTVSDENAWQSRPFFGDDGDSDFSPSKFKPTVSDNVLSLTKTETFNNLVVSQSNQNVHRDTGEESLSSDYYGHVAGDGDADSNLTNPWWQAGNESHMNPAKIAVGFYYQIPRYISSTFNIFNSVTLTVNFTKVTSQDMSSCDVVVKPKSSSSMAAGTEVLSAETQYKHTALNGKSQSVSVTISRSDRYLLIGIGGTMNSHGVFNQTSSYVILEGMTIDVKITSGVTAASTAAFDDGAAPVWGKNWNYSAQSTGDFTTPYRPSKDSDGSGADAWPIFDNRIDKKYYASDDDSKGTYLSYQGTPLDDGARKGGQSYYKHTQLTVVDAYNYSGGDIAFTFDSMYNDWTNARNAIGLSKQLLPSSRPTTITDLKWTSGKYDYTAGIKNIQISVETDESSRVGVGASSTPIIISTTIAGTRTSFLTVTVSGASRQVGYVEATPRDTRRSCYTLDIYMYDNATLEITATDLGDHESAEKTLQYGGIDPTGPNELTLIDDDEEGYFSTANNDNVWLHEKRVFFTLGSTNDYINAPNFFFIDVVNKNNDDNTPPAEIDASSWSAFSGNSKTENWPVRAYITADDAEEGASLSYNFETGLFGGEVASADDNSNSKRKGIGKYVFRVYAFDLAGNVLTTTEGKNYKDFYINVDYEKPMYDAVILDGENEIGPGKNGTWATSESVVIRLNPQTNESGNTVVFFNGASQNRKCFSFDKNFSSLSSPNMVSGDTLRFTNLESDHNTRVKFDLIVTVKRINFDKTLEIRVVASGSETVAPEFIAWTTPFYLLSGRYDNVDDLDLDDDSFSYTQFAWDDGIQVLIDRQAPSLSNVILYSDQEDTKDDAVEEINDDGEKLIYDDLFAKTPADRKWYHDDYIGAKLSLNDSEFDAYGEGYTVLFATKTFITLDELREYTEKHDLNNEYKNIVRDNNREWEFDWFANYAGDEFDDNVFLLDNSPTGVDLRRGSTARIAGVRLILVWVRDQAGNSSVLHAFYLFGDSNTYTLSGRVAKQEPLPDDSASISLGSTSAMRGDEISIALSVQDYFAPYKLTIGDDNGSKPLLVNWGASNDFALADPALDGLFPTLKEEGGTFEITYKLDAADFGELIAGGGRACSFEFSRRLTVTYGDIATASVEYKAEEVTANDIAIPLDAQYAQYAESIKNAFVLRYHITADDGTDKLLYASNTGRGYVDDPEDPDVKKDENGAAVYFAAIDVGTYNAYAFIPYDNDLFVMYNIDFEDDAATAPKQTLINPLQISITPRSLYILPADSDKLTSVYGEAISLEAGLFTDTEGAVKWEKELDLLKGKFKLDVDGWGGDEPIPAGSYRIVPDGEFTMSDNYTLNYSSVDIFYTVSQREIEIILLDGEKQFGDDDPQLGFGVKEGQVDEDTLAGIFENCDPYGAELSGYKTFTHFGVQREAGERVGQYKFNSDLSRIQIDSNYKLVFEDGEIEEDGTTKAVFTINKRTVNIKVTGATYLEFNGELDPATVRPGYALAESKDEIALVKEELEKIMNVAGMLTLSGEPIVETQEGYSKVERYQASLGEYENDCLVVQFAAEGDIYYVYYAEQGTVIISPRADATITLTFGEQWLSTLLSYRDNRDKYDVKIDGVDSKSQFATIGWELSIDGYESGGYLPVGSYTAKIGKVIFRDKDGEDVSANYKWIAGDIPVTVVPAEIVVVPHIEKSTKTYGAPDSEYGIGFEIKSIGKTTEVGDDLNFAGEYSLDDIKALINYGRSFEYVRSVLNGDAYVAGQDGDPVTVDGVNRDGGRYVLTISGNPSISASEFTLTVNTLEDLFLEISPREITLDLAGFVGIHKNYDGTDFAFYSGNTLVTGGETLAYDLSAQLAFATDRLLLEFEARYSEIGGGAEQIKADITFASLKLGGESAPDYVIKWITNSMNNGAKLNGAELPADGEPTQFEANATITISYVDNNIDISTIPEEEYPYIYINPAVIGVNNSGDISVNKIYDGSATISVNDIVVSAKMSSGVSAYLLSRATSVRFVVSDAFRNSIDIQTATANIEQHVAVSIFFSFENIDLDALTFANDNETYPEYMGLGVWVGVKTVAGQKGIQVDFGSLLVIVQPKVLNGASFKNIESVERDYNGQKDIAIDFELESGALASGDTLSTLGLTLYGEAESKDAGGRKVTIAKEEHLSQNYTVDIASVNEKFVDLNVEIGKAKLIPNIIFNDAVYNASAELGKSQYEFATLCFRTEQFNDQLKEELKLLTYDQDALSIFLSYLGKQNGNVIVDVEKHAVLICGLTLEVGEGFNLANYQLINVYDAEGELTEVELKDGETYDNIEILDAIKLSPADMQIIDENVIVADKVYDGTTNASIEVRLPQNMPEEDRDLIRLEAQGVYHSANAGENITVSIVTGAARIVLTEKGASSEKAEYLLNNYVIKYTATQFKGVIKERPVTVEVTLSDKQYDGTRDIKTNLISYTFGDEMLEHDRNYYNVQTLSGAYFDDKNVSGKDALNPGTVYRPNITDRRSVLSNYVFAVATDKAPDATDDVPHGALYAVVLEDGTFMLAKDYFARVESAEGSSSDALIAEDGDPSQPSSPAIKVTKYYYELPSSSWFIADIADNQEAIDTAKASEATIGYYMSGSQGYWLVTESYGANHSDVAVQILESGATLTYIRTQGKVTAVSLSVPSNIVVRIGNSDKFVKEYDGTVKFFGKEGVDYALSSNLIGKKGNDDVYVDLDADQAPVFDKSDSTATKILFAFKLAGADKGNYILLNSQATVTARITKRTITATLADAVDVPHGTVISSIKGDITYSMPGKEGEDDKEVFFDASDGNAFYMFAHDYLYLLGFIGETSPNLTPADPADQKYVDALVDGSLYKRNADGKYEPTNDRDNQTYIKLSGNFLSVPSARAVFTTSTPDAGADDQFVSYTLATLGNATNFEFKPAYTNGKTSKVNIVVKDVYVAMTSNQFTVQYGGSVPSGNGRIAFYDSNNQPYAFASGESYNSLFVVGGIDYGPVMSWYEYGYGDVMIGTGIAAGTENPADIFTLPEIRDSYTSYVARFGAPAGVDYAEGTVNGQPRLNEKIKNYRFHFGHITHQQVDAKDQPVSVFYIDFTSKDPSHPEEGDLTTSDVFCRTQASTLEILPPEFRADEFIVSNGLEFVYDDSDKLPNVVSGTIAGDEISLEKEDGEIITEVKNAGTYTGYIRVTRTFRWNESDITGVQVTWRSSEMYNVKVNRATPQFKTTDLSKVYDGKTLKYDVMRLVTFIGTGGGISEAGEVKLSYKKLIGSTYYDAYGESNGQPLFADGENYYYLDARGNRIDWTGNAIEYTITDVGTYKVVMSLTQTYLNRKQNNYVAIEFYAYVSVTLRKVTVSDVTVTGYQAAGTDALGATIYSGMYDPNTDYTKVVDYKVATELAASDALTQDSDAYIGKGKTKVIGLENVKSAGRYPFQIVISANVNESNYTLTSAKGVLELTANDFNSVDSFGETGSDNLKFVDESNKGVIANRFVVRQITKTGGTGSDLSLWNKIETYMPYVTSNAKLVGVVQAQLYYGKSVVDTTGKKMEITIEIPHSVDADLEDIVVYVKNRNGGITMLPADQYYKNAGKLTFTTDYLGEIIFVDVSTNSIPAWAIWTATAIIASVAAFFVWLIAAIVLRKAKLKKLV